MFFFSISFAQKNEETVYPILFNKLLGALPVITYASAIGNL